MRARAFKAWAEKNLLSVTLYEALEGTHPIYTLGVHIYNYIQRFAPFLHHIYFNFLEIFPSCTSAKNLLGKKKFIALLEKIQPTVILSVHDHLNHAFFEVARNALDYQPLCVTYCGELYGGYGFSKHWVNPKANAFFGAVKETCQSALSLGLPQARCHEGGLLLDPKFKSQTITEEARKNFIKNTLQLDPHKPILLLSTGANSANNHLKILKALNKQSVNIQVVALCGKNSATNKTLQDFSKSCPQLSLCTLAYWDDMSTLMQSVDIIFARPGTGTTSEAIATNCPIIFNGIGGVMPQEHITLKYFRHYQACCFAKSPKKLSQILKTLTENPENLADLKAKQKALPTKHDPQTIIEKIIELSTVASA